MSIWRYADDLPQVPGSARITLGEGDTPLVRSRSIGPAENLPRLFFKLESVNPSGSYKDRFAASAVAHMLARGQRRCIATSSGNTGAALAAYCAAAGIDCRIAIVETAPAGKLQQMLAYGANIFRVRGFGLDPKVTAATFARLQEVADAPDAALQISAFHYSPLGMAGVRTIAFEMTEQAQGPVDHVFTPAGGGGLTLATAQGFAHLVATGRLAGSPRVECVQPEGNDTIAGPLRDGRDAAVDVTCTTKISGLQVANVIDGHETLKACRASGGTGHTVTDEEVFAAQIRLAREEGIFAEPAGAVALAGALQAARSGAIAPGATVICLVTGSGFKDMTSIERMNVDAPCPTIDLDDLA